MKWYMFEYDDRETVKAFNSYSEARSAIDGTWHREDNELYHYNRMWLGTKRALMVNGFDNVRFVRN